MKKLLFLFSILIISSCTKIEDVIVGDNTLPLDNTIDNTIIETYINKLYISTIGREPTENELYRQCINTDDPTEKKYFQQLYCNLVKYPEINLKDITKSC